MKKLAGFRLWTFRRFNAGWFIRLGASGYGPGLLCLYRAAQPSFSERNGYRRFWPAYPARWRFRVLEKE